MVRRRLGERASVEEGHNSRTHSSDTEHMDLDALMSSVCGFCVCVPMPPATSPLPGSHEALRFGHGVNKQCVCVCKQLTDLLYLVLTPYLVSFMSHA